MMRILISNDDGVHAPGLKILYDKIKKIADVWVVAPLEEQSTTGHSLTLHKPLRMVQVSRRFYGVSGSPADCVYMGIREVMGGLPDMVISGINRGANLGQDVFYSGTVSAAREACILGVPAIAVSLAVDFGANAVEKDFNYATAAVLTARLLNRVSKLHLPAYTLLNLNVPDLPITRVKGFKLARQGYRIYDGKILRRKDHRGRDYFWIGGNYKGFKPEENTDCMAVDQGFASVTPIKLDCTDLQSLASLSQSFPEVRRTQRKPRTAHV